MLKTYWVARREFLATVLTKGFIIGILMTPIFVLIVGGAIAVMKNLKEPRIVGSVAVIDQSGMLAERIRYQFSEASINDESDELAKDVSQKTQEQAARIGLSEKQLEQASGPIGAAAQEAVKQAIESGPKLSVELLPPSVSIDDAKKPLETVEIRRAKDGSEDGPIPRLAVVVIPKETVIGDKDGKFPDFISFFPQRLDFEIQQRIHRRIADAIVKGRLAANAGLNESGLTPERVLEIAKRPRAEAKTVSKEGDKASIGAFAMFLPMGFMMLLMVTVLTSGQLLLTSTVEEKSTRVMEVLLSAISPMQLMVGKIIGYMCVGLIILLLYGGLGIGGLIVANQSGLIQTSQLVYFVVFFMIAYFLVAAMMAAIGSAVNDMREAQNLMTPVMALLMIPWLTWFVIQRAPNSAIATAMSFIPGINPFVMVIRLCGSEPVPTWQIPVAIAVGLLSVVIASWAAAKIFRIGVLMYGKPPNMKTLLRWVRMA